MPVTYLAKKSFESDTKATAVSSSDTEASRDSKFAPEGLIQLANAVVPPGEDCHEGEIAEPPCLPTLKQPPVETVLSGSESSDDGNTTAAKAPKIVSS